MPRQVVTCVPHRVRGVQPSLPRAKNPRAIVIYVSVHEYNLPKNALFARDGKGLLLINKMAIIGQGCDFGRIKEGNSLAFEALKQARDAEVRADTLVREAETEARSLYSSSRRQAQSIREESLKEAKDKAQAQIKAATDRASADIELLEKNVEDECGAIRGEARTHMDKVADKVIERIVASYGNR
jgi:F0F1-type ATP synthase membrane subunit b/b'